MSNNKESASVAALTATKGELKSNALTQDIQQYNYKPNLFNLPFYRKIGDVTPERLIKLDDFLAMVKNPSIGDKQNAAALTPYSANGKQKQDAINAQYHAIIVDHDDDNLTKEQLCAKYDKFDTNYIAFTTSSHQQNKKGVNANRWKVVIPLAAPINQRQFSTISLAVTLLMEADLAQVRAQQVFFAPNKLTKQAPYEYITRLDSLFLNIRDADSKLINAATPIFEQYERSKEVEAKTAKAKPRNVIKNHSSIIELVNDAYDLESVILAAGYKKQGKKYLSPFSESGLAGVVISDRKLYSHHGVSDPLSSLNHDGHALDTFDVLRCLHHSGDFSATIKHYANELDPDGQKQRQKEYAKSVFEPSSINTQKAIGEMFEKPQEHIVQATCDLNTPPGLAGDICRYIELSARRPRPELYPLAALHFMALIGRKRKSVFTSKLNLLTLGIAQTAAGKEAPQNIVKNLSNEFDCSRHLYGNSGSFKDLIMNLVEGDGSSLYIVDEVHSFLGAMKSNTAQTYETKMEAEILTMSTTELYSFRGAEKRELAKQFNSKIAWAEKKLAEMAEDDSDKQKFERMLAKYNQTLGYIENGWPSPFFSMMGHSVPERLDSFASVDNIGSGLLGRMLITRCPDTREKLKRTKPDKVEQASLHDSISYVISQIQQDNREIDVTEEAEEYLNKCVDWYEDDEQLNDSIVGGIYARASEHLYKIASILGLEGATIQLKHAQYAHALVSNSVNDIKYLILKGYASRSDAEATTVLRHAKETVLKNCKGSGLRPSKVKEKIRSCAGIRELQAADGSRDIPQQIIEELIKTKHLLYEELGQKRRYLTIGVM